MSEDNRYSQIIEKIFFAYYKKNVSEITFERTEIEDAAEELKIKLPKNLGDLIYSFRYRAALPQSIIKTAPKNKVWIIRPAGRSRYQFVAIREILLSPNQSLAETKIADSTPGIVAKYSLNDEQALLAVLRYNRMLDIFTGVTCSSLQNHLRTTAPDIGQVEIDELYIGVDARGAHYVLPVQAKGGSDKLSIVQIEQDVKVCKHKFADLICKPIAAQFMGENLIALFEFEETKDGLRVSSEKHYRLVPQEEISSQDLETYQAR